MAHMESYWLRLGLMGLFLMPVAYIGFIAVAAIHELAGHGLAAVLAGGRFVGFLLDFDGMGMAFTVPPKGGMGWYPMLTLAGGVAATTLAGAGFLAAGVFCRRRLFVRLTLLVLALNCLLEGPPYAFWNALHPAPPGDIAYLLAEAKSPWLRPALMGVSAPIALSAVGALGLLLFQGISQYLAGGERLTGWRRAVPLALLAGAGAGLSFLFDWDSLAPGIGRLPNRVEASAFAVTGVVLFFYRPRSSPGGVEIGKIGPPLAIAWLAALALLTAMPMWLRKGVFWT